MKPVILDNNGDLSFLLIVEITPQPAVITPYAVGNTKVVGCELKPEEKQKAVRAAMTERPELFNKLKELALANYVHL